eukprot:CAMPEP_0171097058 /NCGR_PEP_ID=MMETSP0766_2-20121228/46823_1 /TAXON_ID=439317 /ORGANISM="Gambierdiscus australes, Strain CAWD 149" /LENGTH=390 /DNA_ID=CAMNT_0011556181 /DNA_START=68 /DNA_END=1240 /DNA_ORIENTATION=-
MAMVDPMRRRLTVSQCGAAKVGDPGSFPGEDMPAKIESAGLTAIFERTEIEHRKVVLIASVTDNDLKRRRSFAEKDTDVISTFTSAEEATQWVHSRGVGWSCKKGLKPESPNQDSFSVLIVENEFALYCVYDGHGPAGHDVSNFVRETVVKLFLGNAERATNPKRAFEAAFTDGQKLLEDVGSSAIDASMSGTTCTMVYHDLTKDRLTIAHVGDSRAVLGRKHKEPAPDGAGLILTTSVAQDLTIDHKPNDPDEKKRIESADPPGRVVFDGYYNHRVFARTGMYPGLNMSRAIGDVLGHKEAGLTAWPDVKEIDLPSERPAADCGLALLLCTDGVWEFISSEEAMKLVFDFPPANATEAMTKLVELGWRRWMEDSDHEISDDITGILVAL